MSRQAENLRAEQGCVRAIVGVLAFALFLPLSLATAADLTVTVTDKDGKPVPDSVVFLMGGPPTEPGPTVKMVQRDQSFNPDVLAISVGTKIEFPNEDPFRHHVYSFSPAKRFELKLYGGDEVQEVTFDQAGEIAMGCNIHDDMLGYIYVVDTNLLGTTNENGAATISGLEDGSSYEAQVWHPRLRGPTRRTAQTVTATQSATIEIGLKRDRRKQSGSDFEEGAY
ncbi:MAG: methylamine utilization protein [Rhodospirillaceae bacterium]|jgi:plastocyanin|nr:methylamine utilization protein [Rhodospirillaceae bacterium]MBT5239437.1 methylamine utilization protein [Rhodospirillaceae bacterium]MBT5564281.1 methylamine utilization protein [Rhodospirillaceae bacterium]MBT6088845.1 methylamine utilization protein [Rhodospirillaceae bacterium]